VINRLEIIQNQIDNERNDSYRMRVKVEIDVRKNNLENGISKNG